VAGSRVLLSEPLQESPADIERELPPTGSKALSPSASIQYARAN